jgi:hypothetical protein
MEAKLEQFSESVSSCSVSSDIFNCLHHFLANFDVGPVRYYAVEENHSNVTLVCEGESGNSPLVATTLSTGGTTKISPTSPSPFAWDTLMCLEKKTAVVFSRVDDHPSFGRPVRRFVGDLLLHFEVGSNVGLTPLERQKRSGGGNWIDIPVFSGPVQVGKVSADLKCGAAIEWIRSFQKHVPSITTAVRLAVMSHNSLLRHSLDRLKVIARERFSGVRSIYDIPNVFTEVLAQNAVVRADYSDHCFVFERGLIPSLAFSRSGRIPCKPLLRVSGTQADSVLVHRDPSLPLQAAEQLCGELDKSLCLASLSNKHAIEHQLKQLGHPNISYFKDIGLEHVMLVAVFDNNCGLSDLFRLGRNATGSPFAFIESRCVQGVADTVYREAMIHAREFVLKPSAVALAVRETDPFAEVGGDSQESWKRIGEAVIGELEPQITVGIGKSAVGVPRSRKQVVCTIEDVFGVSKIDKRSETAKLLYTSGTIPLRRDAGSISSDFLTDRTLHETILNRNRFVALFNITDAVDLGYMYDSVASAAGIPLKLHGNNVGAIMLLSTECDLRPEIVSPLLLAASRATTSLLETHAVERGQTLLRGIRHDVANMFQFFTQRIEENTSRLRHLRESLSDFLGSAVGGWDAKEVSGIDLSLTRASVPIVENDLALMKDEFAALSLLIAGHTPGTSMFSQDLEGMCEKRTVSGVLKLAWDLAKAKHLSESSRYSHAEIGYEGELDAKIWVYPPRIHVCLYNLFANALKFSRKGIVKCTVSIHRMDASSSDTEIRSGDVLVVNVQNIASVKDAKNLERKLAGDMLWPVAGGRDLGPAGHSDRVGTALVALFVRNYRLRTRRIASLALECTPISSSLTTVSIVVKFPLLTPLKNRF